MTDSNSIEKEILLRAPKSRVWRALTDATQFGTWFRVTFETPFEPGRLSTGRMAIPGYENREMEITIDRMDPEDYFSYRWHPFALDEAVDYSSEPMTLVEFRLEESDGGTLLKISETGFDKIPAARREMALTMNEKGWSGQAKNIQRYVEG
jgi:uncharacterized protein YndB with AHSA1/START domain